MTVSQALAILKVAFPKRTTYVGMTAFNHWHAFRGTIEQRVLFMVGMQPGLDGDKCTHFYGDSIEACLNNALASADVKEFQTADEFASDHEVITLKSNPA